jgi:DNA topoisomerase-1
MTMSVAQELYEGVNLAGEGQAALVTYIRTDSVRVSADAQAEALRFIGDKYGKEYLPEKPNFYKSKKSAQDAHEAIRPISLERTPESIREKTGKNQYRLYKLIYERFLASQMTEAVYDTLTIDTEAERYLFKSSGRTLRFKGFTAVYDEYREKKASEDDAENARLPDVKEGDALLLHSLLPEQKFTKPPARYSDASLVKTMEEKGIGRPSTYATIIGTLQKRTYTEKEGKYLKPTELAFKVNDLLLKYFDNIVNVEFTAGMEEQLDDIEEGGRDWKEIIADFYPSFEERLKSAQDGGAEETDIPCDKCGTLMVIKNGRYGKFLICPNYPDCKNTRSLEEPELSDIPCVKCGKPMLIKNGKYGKYLACSGYPDCKNIQPLEKAEDSGEVCEKCGGRMLIKNGRYGKFLGCENYPDCKNIKNLGDEESDEICPACGGRYVLRSGRYGKYLYCPACKENKPVREVVAKCPKCGKEVLKKTTRAHKVFYGCSGYPDCDFVSWDVPLDEKCPKCGGFLTKKTTKAGDKTVCPNKDCGYEAERGEN